MDYKQKIEDLLTLYFIMGSQNGQGNPEYVLQQAIEGGITLFQFREKGEGALQGDEKRRLGERLKQICKDAGVPFIVNDDIELAMQLDADGVHVGQEDEKAAVTRKQIGNKILGVSTHTLEEAHQAIADGADYLGLGPIFPTESKDDIRKVHGLDLIQAFRRHDIQTPIVGIGGIMSANASDVIQAGGDGVSVISAIAGAEDAKQATVQLKQAVRKEQLEDF
ncbi:thiamine phosphate synthase [Pontibacillus marinus]|uniref:Thiamine-phosphate synthase n=1 Tax=Pontibacillus marinus BH030004 = DSM 16465 TaxID=1385511 RepID=A0A0A5GKE9_9BACI|nr:thiamine phosphate synthase [Pontibacillus marinus]KGX91708.1 thiamine-phosphate pyrophosphorylase [Pontibacillus marinus BH030004 = DSM 16465]